MSQITCLKFVLFFVLFYGVTCAAVNLFPQEEKLQELSNTNASSTPSVYEYVVVTEPVPFNCEEEVIESKEFTILLNGSLFLPNNQQIYDYESYVLNNDTVFICSHNTQTESDASSEFSEEFLACGHVLIEPHQFALIDNKTLYVQAYNLFYTPGNYFLHGDGVYVCAPDYNSLLKNSTNVTLEVYDEKFSVAYTYVTLFGISLSIISLILHLIVFCMVPDVRNLPGCCLASLSLSLLLAYLCFASTAVVSDSQDCANLGAAIYYFFLASFFWMNAIAFDVWRSFRVVVRELRISSHRIPWRRFLVYSSYSWLIPAVLVGVACYADKSDFLPEEYRPSFGTTVCWFGKRKALLVFFAAPMCFVMVLNAIFFLDSSYIINKATMKPTQGQRDPMLKKRFFMFMRLALIMGLTWIFGIIAGYVNQAFLWYFFVILNTLQGLFIFIVFSCSSKVRNHFFGKLKGQFKNRQSTSTSTSVRTVSGAF